MKKLLRIGLTAGVAVGVGIGGANVAYATTHPAAPRAAASSSKKPKPSTSASRTKLVACLKRHGVTLPAGAGNRFGNRPPGGFAPGQPTTQPDSIVADSAAARLRIA